MLSFLSALINALAPGNYVRHSYMDDSINPVIAIKQAVNICDSEIEWLLDCWFGTIIILVIICGICVFGDIKDQIKKYSIISILALAMPVIAVFPVRLGYSSGDYFPNRCQFVLDLTLIIVLLNLAFVIGCYIGLWYASDKKTIIAICLASAFTTLLVNYHPIRDLVIVQQSSEILNGNVKKYYDKCQKIYQYLDGCGYIDVVIEDYPDTIEGFGSMGLSDDAENWVNVAVAQFYGVKSINIESEN